MYECVYNYTFASMYVCMASMYMCTLLLSDVLKTTPLKGYWILASLACGCIRTVYPCKTRKWLCKYVVCRFTCIVYVHIDTYFVLFGSNGCVIPRFRVNCLGCVILRYWFSLLAVCTHPEYFCETYALLNTSCGHASPCFSGNIRFYVQQNDCSNYARKGLCVQIDLKTPELARLFFESKKSNLFWQCHEEGEGPRKMQNIIFETKQALVRSRGSMSTQMQNALHIRA